MKTTPANVEEALRTTPVLANVDVIVVGGGMSGYAAAIGAAATGASTVLLEAESYLGGLLTGALAEVVQWERDAKGDPTVGGVWLETKRRLIEAGGTPGTLRFEGPMWGPHIRMPELAPCITPFDPEILKLVLEEQCRDAGVDVRLNSNVVGVVQDGAEVRGVLLDGKAGRHAVLGTTVVDATGDADIAAWAGAPYRLGDDATSELPGATLHMHVHGVQQEPLWEYVQANPDDVPRWAHLMPVDGAPFPPARPFLPFACHGFQQSMAAAQQQGELPAIKGELGIWPSHGHGRVEVNVTRVDGVDGTDMTNLSTDVLALRQQCHAIMAYLRRHVPGFENAYISQTADQVQYRETRRIAAEYTMTDEDLLQGHAFTDCIAVAAYPSEIHSAVDGERIWAIPDHAYQIPYRIMLPRDVDGVIIGSARALSASRAVVGALRISPTPIATGHAAGVAAGLAVRDGQSVRNVDIPNLQSTLRDQGAAIPS